MPGRRPIGAYRHRVTILRRTVVQTPDGQEETWSPTATRWAAVEPLSSRARAEYQQVLGEVTHRFRFRGVVSLPFGGTRLAWRGETYELAEPAVVSPLGDETTVAARRLTAA